MFVKIVFVPFNEHENLKKSMMANKLYIHAADPSGRRFIVENFLIHFN